MAEATNDGSPISLLCVDDDLDVLDLLKKHFERRPDFSVFTSASSTEALNLIGQYQFDAIIADYAMPDLDGIGLLKQIRSQHDPALFIILTGRRLAHVAIEVLNNAGDYYVQKGMDVLSEMPKVESFIRNSVAERCSHRLIPSEEELTPALPENQLDLICSILPDGSCMRVNEGYARFIGRNAGEINGTPFFAVVPENEREEVCNILLALTPEQPVACVEHHLLDSRDTAYLYQWEYQAFFNDDCSVREYVARGKDLAQVIRPDDLLPAETITPKEEEPVQTNICTSPDKPASPELADLAESIDQVQYPIFAIDKNGVVIAWNHAIAALTGVKAHTILGQGDYAYSLPIYGESRPMLIDYILKISTGSDITVFPGITREGDSYTGEIEEVVIRGRPMQAWGKGTPVFDGKGRVIAAVQSLLVNESYQEDCRVPAGQERYIGGVSSIILKVVGEGLGGSIAGAIGSATGGYGVYATDKRLIVVHNPKLDASRQDGVQFGEFIIGELFGATVDMRPRSIAELDNMKIFEVWRRDIVSIDLKTPRFLAGFLIIRIASGGSFRIFVDHKKAFNHLEHLLNLSYPSVIKKVEEITDAELEWLDEIRTYDLIERLQPENPFAEIPHE